MELRKVYRRQEPEKLAYFHQFTGGYMSGVVAIVEWCDTGVVDLWDVRPNDTNAVIFLDNGAHVQESNN